MHYRNGTPALVGDIVRGKTYNKPHEVIGVLVYATETSESCNCRVAFASVSLYPVPTPVAPGTSAGIGHYPVLVEDYGEVRAFDLVYRDPLAVRQLNSPLWLARAGINDCAS